MNWIVWTIGWYVGCSVGDYFWSRSDILKGKKPDTSLDRTVAVFRTLIWITGMIKFW